MKISFRYILALIIFLLFFLYERIYMINMLYVRLDSSTIVATNVLLMLCATLVLFVFGKLQSLKMACHNSYLLFTIILYVMCCAHGNKSGLTISYYIMLLYPFLFFLFAYQCSKEGYSELIRKGVLFVIIGLFVEYLITYDELIHAYGEQFEVTNSSYFLLYLLPFALICRRKKFRLFFVGLISFAIILSLKRGGILALSFGLLVYYWYDLRLSGKKTLSLLKYVIIVAVVFMIVLGVDSIMGGIISSRFNDISESSRSELYPMVIAMILDSSLFELFFGHGWNMVLCNNPMEFSAHNDWLEMLYDIGIVGFIFFVSMVVGFFKTTKKLIKDGSYLAPAAAAYVAIFCVNSMVSHIVLTLTYFCMLSLFWGYVNAQINSNYKL